MLAHLGVAALLASTLLSPVPASAVDTVPDPIKLVPLVSEDIGGWHMMPVNEDCTKTQTHPYVHTDGWIGTLPGDGLWFDYAWGDYDGQPAVSIHGWMGNANPFVKHRVDIFLKCTSDVSQAKRIPGRWDP
jgi:hypothetical protein